MFNRYVLALLFVVSAKPIYAEETMPRAALIQQVYVYGTSLATYFDVPTTFKAAQDIEELAMDDAYSECFEFGDEFQCQSFIDSLPLFIDFALSNPMFEAKLNLLNDKWDEFLRNLKNSNDRNSATFIRNRLFDLFKKHTDQLNLRITSSIAKYKAPCKNYSSLKYRAHCEKKAALTVFKFEAPWKTQSTLNQYNNAVTEFLKTL